MKKNEFNELAIKLMDQENHSKERALEKLDEMEDICFITGKMKFIPKVVAARMYIQKTY